MGAEWREREGKASAGKPQLGVCILTGEQQLSAGYHNARASQAQSRSGRGHNGEGGGWRGCVGGGGATRKQTKGELLGCCEAMRGRRSPEMF